MRDFIEAMNILLEYHQSDVYSPFHCEHDVLAVHFVHPEVVSEDDLKRLNDLGFVPDSDHFVSYRFGSC